LEIQLNNQRQMPETIYMINQLKQKRN